MKARAFSIVLVLCTVACSEVDPISEHSAFPDLAPLPELRNGVVRLSVIAVRQDSNEQELEVRIESADVRWSSYEVLMRFDPQEVSLRVITAPLSGFHIVNDMDSSRGVIKAAGFTPTVFEEAVSYRVTLARPGGLLGDDFVAELQLVGTPDGTALSDPAIRVVDGIRVR